MAALSLAPLENPETKLVGSYRLLGAISIQGRYEAS